MVDKIDYEEKLKMVIRKLCPKPINGIFDKESIDDKRHTFAYSLAFYDLKEELGLDDSLWGL